MLSVRTTAPHIVQYIFVNTASGDEAEDEAEEEQVMARSLVQGVDSRQQMGETDTQGREHEMVQVVRSEWAEEVRQVRKMVVDDVTSETIDVKNELLHVRALHGVLLRRERGAESKAEIGARRLDRIE